MMKKFIYITLISLVSILFLAGCGADNKINPEEFPYNHISERFKYQPFVVPNDWDVVSIQSNIQLRHRDLENPENHMYADTPFRYSFSFGRNAPENSVTEETLEKFNEEQALKGETGRQLYYHTYHEHYATLQISANGFLRLIHDFEETEEWKIEGEDMLVLRQGNDWIVNWYKDGKYYDLLISAEANIDTEIAFEELIQHLFF